MGNLKSTAHDQRGAMTRRYGLLRVAQSILYRGDTAPQQQHRTVWCHRHVRHDGSMPVMRKMDGSKARLAQIKTCGSVWACPVCAVKVSEPRRVELSAATVLHQAAGGYVYLATFTFPHYRGQALAELMELFTKARQSFQNCRAWKAVMEKAEKVGVVTSLEVTYSTDNGWHPHLHMLIFCKPDAFAETETGDGRLTSHAIEHLRGEWVRLLEKKGLVDASNRTWAQKYALDIRGGARAAEYIAKWGREEKWGMASELTSAHAKVGRKSTPGAIDHCTPFELLALAKGGSGHAICAFREFVKEFDGKRMLTWSKGLKKHFGIDELEDEDAAAEQALALQDEHQAGELHQNQLQTLTRHGRLGDFLSHVAEHGHGPDPQSVIDSFVQSVLDSGGRQARGDILVDALVVTPYSYFHRPVLVEV